MDIISVVLGADTKKDRTRDSIKIIEYAFASYRMVDLEFKTRRKQHQCVSSRKGKSKGRKSAEWN